MHLPAKKPGVTPCHSVRCFVVFHCAMPGCATRSFVMQRFGRPLVSFSWYFPIPSHRSRVVLLV
eukprot:6236307-Pyramimonas_sp.AAC.4